MNFLRKFGRPPAGIQAKWPHDIPAKALAGILTLRRKAFADQA